MLRLPAQARMITTMALFSLQLLAKPRKDNNNHDYDDDDNNKDVVIACMSKKNDYHDAVIFAPVMVAVAATNKGVIHPRRHPLTLTPSCRRRGRAFAVNPAASTTTLSTSPSNGCPQAHP
jgi:hypothetical protein